MTRRAMDDPPPRYLMQPGAKPWFSSRRFLKDLGTGFFGAAGLIALFVLIWAAR